MNAIVDRHEEVIRTSAVCRNRRPGLLALATGKMRLSNRLGHRLARTGLKESGGALVEMALTLPILLLVVTGIFSFGIAINNYLELTNATAISARIIAVERQQTTDPCADGVKAFYSAAPYLTQANLSFTFTFNGISYAGTSCSSSNYNTGAAGNMTAAGTVQVVATYPCTLGVYGHNYAPGCTLVAQTTELVQ